MRYFHPARPNELQVDLDGRKALTRYLEALKILETSAHVRVKRSKVTPSRTKNHFHATVTLKKSLPIMERIALQLALGDDNVRGLLNWGRARNNDPHPIIFIESDERERRRSVVNGVLISCCDCKNTRKQPRCRHVKALQNSKAEFLPRGNKLP